MLIVNFASFKSSHSVKLQSFFTGRTLTTDLDFVCDEEKNALVSLTQTVLMIGAFFGFVGGFFADKYGRRPVCLVMAIAFTLSLAVNTSENFVHTIPPRKNRQFLEYRLTSLKGSWVNLKRGGIHAFCPSKYIK